MARSILKIILFSSDDEDTADDRAITAVGLLNTLETMLGEFKRTIWLNDKAVFAYCAVKLIFCFY